MHRAPKPNPSYRTRTQRVLLSFLYATTVTAIFALVCPAILVAIVAVYARFVIHKSVEIEWGVLGMLQDPLALVACVVVFVAVFVLRLRR
jgi:hypothetical protein